MARKNNIRSMRFSDTMIEMIEAQTGDTFTAKFEALVTCCMCKLPEKEKQLERITNEITREKERLQNLKKKRQELENTMDTLNDSIKRILRGANWTIEQIEKM